MYSIVAYGTYKPWTNIMQLAQHVATGWMVQKLNPRGSESFRTEPRTHPASCTMDTMSFLWV